jgi:hypothetical protein
MEVIMAGWRHVPAATARGRAGGGIALRAEETTMGSRRRYVVVLALLAGLWTWGSPRASVAGTFYSWSPLHGAGWEDNYSLNDDYQTFATDTGSLTVYWDPASMIPDSYVAASSGTAGYEVMAYNPSWAGDMLTGVGLDGATVTVFFSGGDVSVSVQGGYHQEFGFQLQSVPEPSSLLMLPLGMAGVALGLAARRARKRRGSRGPAGR